MDIVGLSAQMRDVSAQVLWWFWRRRFRETIRAIRDCAKVTAAFGISVEEASRSFTAFKAAWDAMWDAMSEAEKEEFRQLDATP